MEGVHRSLQKYAKFNSVPTLIVCRLVPTLPVLGHSRDILAVCKSTVQSVRLSIDECIQ
jgi:hypothetical protein